MSAEDALLHTYFEGECVANVTARHGSRTETRLLKLAIEHAILRHLQFFVYMCVRYMRIVTMPEKILFSCRCVLLFSGLRI